MTELFMKLLNMSINAGWLVLAVLLVRIIFRKAPKWLFPLLWSFVGIRLLMPNALESRLSVIPDISGFSASEQGLLSAKGFTAPVPYVGIVWCTGMAAMLLFEALSYVHLRSKVKTAVRLSSNVYQSEHVNAPFILGLFAPRIYIPFHIKSKELDSIIAHERAHIKRRDHWLKPIAFLILSLHWFNPLIWIAYYFLCKDIELACDEYAIKDMSDSQRAAYSQTLLSCTANQRIFAACPLAFGSKNVKTRIRAVLSYRKPHTWIITVTAILVLAVVACFMTNPRQSKESTAQGSNYIDLNQPPILDVIQNGQTISDRSSSEDRQREDDETHLKTVYPVYYCTVSGCTNSYLGNGASSTVSHTMSSYSYTGNNYHSGSLHYVRYEHSCLQCGRTTGYWDHYSCPGNGHCILPQSVFPVLTDK